MGVDFFGLKRLAALRANHHGIEHLAALVVLVQQGPSTFVNHVDVTPMDNCHHDRIQIKALLGEDVLMAFGRLLVWNATQHALSD
jgi:hypothetical protein